MDTHTHTSGNPLDEHTHTHTVEPRAEIRSDLLPTLGCRDGLLTPRLVTKPELRKASGCPRRGLNRPDRQYGIPVGFPQYCLESMRTGQAWVGSVTLGLWSLALFGMVSGH